MKNWVYIATIAVLLLFSACATIVPPNGGPRDTQAPKLLNKSKVDSLINFSGGKIEIEFDEYIKLQDIQNSFDISPLTNTPPRISIKKKSLVIELPDSLLESNTTYNVNFGDAVRDRRENNAYKDLHLVFSTGNYFDSLSLTGQVYDAENGSPDSIKVMLYPENIADSLLLKQRPLYVSHAVNGQFMFTGLPAKRFKIAALKDKNANYLYDSKGEKIAFHQNIIDINNPDSSLILYSFVEQSMRDTNSSSLTKKKNGAALSYTIQPDIKQQRLLDIKDSLFIKKTDTNSNIDISKIRFYENDILDLIVNIELDSLKEQVLISPEWKMGTAYSLILMPGFLSGYDTALSVADTINFKTMNTDDYGSISVIIDSALIKAGAYIQLYHQDKLIKQLAATYEMVSFELLKPQEYELRLLYDENDNGSWDAGLLSTKKQPEITIALPQKIKLKPNWEERIEWQLGSKKSKMGLK